MTGRGQRPLGAQTEAMRPGRRDEVEHPGPKEGFARLRVGIEDDLQQCIHCGMCLQACPTYLLTGLETESPRGRIHLMDALAKGRIEATDRTTLHLDRCLGCRACEAVCPSGVLYGKLIELTRAEIAIRRPSFMRKAVLRSVIARPRVLDLAARIGSLYERIGIRALVRRTGLVRVLPRGLRRMESLYPPLTRPRYRAPATPAAPVARVALLLGCVMRVAYGDVHTAAARVLVRLGVEVVDVPDQACCGALHAHSGDRDAARDLARRAIAAFERAKVDAVVVDAAGCGAHMKEYGQLLADDPGWARRAAAFAAKVRDVSEYLASRDLPRRLGRLEMRVTYQDACHLAHAQRIRTQPRDLLRRIEGLALVEMPQSDVCCGSAGTYNVTQPEYADALQAAKVGAIRSTGAEAVASANPGCMLQIQAGLRAQGSDVKVFHVVELLDRAMSR